MVRNIVICSDGTGHGGRKQTNVLRLFNVLDKDCRRQIACYSPGVGSNPLYPGIRLSCGSDARKSVAKPSILIPRVVKRFNGLAFGDGILQDVEQLYDFLMDRYTDGDRIYLFGFSRGAFTVRVLAGLLYRCGLLKKEHRNQYAQAFELYKHHFEKLRESERKKLKAEVRRFRKRFSWPRRTIEFLGIWDTVKSVGYLWPKSLPHTRHNCMVKTVRHALSIGESRSFYAPSSWGGLDGDRSRRIKSQDVQEVWFAGSHSDVGGGYDEDENELSKDSLRWIVNEACARGLLVDDASYQEMLAPGPTPCYIPHNEVKKLWWCVVEYLPRWELENEPPPPRRRFKWRPSGRRTIEMFARNGEVLIDRRAARVYSRGDTCPWAGIDQGELKVRFVDTAAGDLERDRASGGLGSASPTASPR